MVHTTHAVQSFFAQLTPRERDVMHLVAIGKPNKIIAAELGVSQRTIEAHRARIFQKMKVRNAVELARRVVLHLPTAAVPPATSGMYVAQPPQRSS